MTLLWPEIAAAILAPNLIGLDFDTGEGGLELTLTGDCMGIEVIAFSFLGKTLNVFLTL